MQGRVSRETWTGEKEFCKNSMPLQDKGIHSLIPPCSIGHDMAVMSLCNHTILSYGTFGYWSGFLAGGSVIEPQLWAEYNK